MFFADLGCFLTVVGFLPGFADLCWVLLGFTAFLIAGGERSKRAKRASEALWCLLWVSRAHPCFRWCPLAFSCVASFARPWFACCLFFLLLYLASHASTALKRFRSYCCMLPLLSYVFALPVHLLRQVFCRTGGWRIPRRVCLTRKFPC